jgi:pseudaminic acid synthase
VTDGPRIEIAGRAVGAGCPVYVIAELSANHGGDLERARAIVRAAAEAGCDAVKLQTYTADTLTLDCDAPPFRIEGGTLWDGRTLHELYLEAATPWEWQPELFALAASLGLHAFSSPFDATAIEFLEDLDVPAMKIASFELVDLPLIRRAAASGKPVILSTGMASEEEIREAVDTARAAGAGGVAILRTNSAYPAPPEEMHLRTIPWLTKTFDAPAGLSDHTLGIAVPVAAVALGASIVEKHVCLSRDVPGPDTAFSLEPAELGAVAVRRSRSRPTRRESTTNPGLVRAAPRPPGRRGRSPRRSPFAPPSDSERPPAPRADHATQRVALAPVQFAVAVDGPAERRQVEPCRVLRHPLLLRTRRQSPRASRQLPVSTARANLVIGPVSSQPRTSRNADASSRCSAPSSRRAVSPATRPS